MKAVLKAVVQLVPKGVREHYWNSRLGRFYSEHIIGFDNIYSEEYYLSHANSEYVIRGSQELARDLFNIVHPETVIDIGCGNGDLLVGFKNLGASVLGCDFSLAAKTLCQDRGLSFETLDLREKQERDSIQQTADLVTCFEVAEHLPEEYAADLVAFLVKRAPVVGFTGADVGQGGTCHFNEQPKSYWIELFKGHGYSYDQACSERLRRDWKERDVLSYLTKNFIMLRRA